MFGGMFGLRAGNTGERCEREESQDEEGLVVERKDGNINVC
jgi:hypothetical protein